MTNKTDANTLMLAVAKGDQGAFRTLAQLVSPRAYALAVRLMNGDTGAAEDVVQDVLVKVWKSAPKWQAKGSAVGYVHRLIYTTSIDKIRQRNIRPEQFGDELVADVQADPAPSAHKKLEQKQQQQALYKLLGTLPERQRSAMVLTYLQEMPQKDVALTLGTSVKAVESLLIRAKRSLKETAPTYGLSLN